MIRKYLIEKKGYNPQNIITLRDDNNNFEKPTYYNIIKNLNLLIEKANQDKDCEEIFILYSGHGTYIKDLNRDEKDGRDEVIVPCDFKLIKDDDLSNIIRKLRDNIQCYCLMDCCHSGTILDLPYVHTTNMGKTIIQSDNSKIYATYNNKKIVMISGCLDSQTSSDVYNIYNNDKDMTDYMINNDRAGGALTANFIKIVYNNPRIKFIECLPLLHLVLKLQRFTQLPQLSTSYQFIKNKNIINNMVPKRKNMIKINSKNIQSKSDTKEYTKDNKQNECIKVNENSKLVFRYKKIIKI
jgi:GTP:adenosylcobinamide-phosphate guanylyltransferase